MIDERHCEKRVRDRGQKKDNSIKGTRPGGEIIVAHPRRREGNQRQPKQKMQIRPENSTIHLSRGLKKVMVVIPIDPHKNEADQIAEKHRDRGLKRRQIPSFGNFEFEYHDGDDNRNHTVAKRFQSPLRHLRCVAFVFWERQM